MIPPAPPPNKFCLLFPVSNNIKNQVCIRFPKRRLDSGGEGGVVVGGFASASHSFIWPWWPLTPSTSDAGTWPAARHPAALASAAARPWLG